MVFDTESRLQNVTLKLTDIIGRTVYETPFTKTENAFDISHLQKGVYILTIQNIKKRVLTKKIIKLGTQKIYSDVQLSPKTKGSRTKE